MCTKSLTQIKHMFQHDFCAEEEPSRINPSGYTNESENYVERAHETVSTSLKGIVSYRSLCRFPFLFYNTYWNLIIVYCICFISNLSIHRDA